MTDMSHPLSGDEFLSVFVFVADLLLLDETPDEVLPPALDDLVEESLSDFVTLLPDFVELQDDSVGVNLDVDAGIVLLLVSDTHFRYSMSELSLLAAAVVLVYQLAFFGSG